MTGVVATIANTGSAILLFVSPETAIGIGTTSAVQTNIVTASSTVGGATFAWTYESGDGSITALTPSAASTRWSASGLLSPESRDANWRVTASSGGVPFASLVVPVSIQRL